MTFTVNKVFMRYICMECHIPFSFHFQPDLYCGLINRMELPLTNEDYSFLPWTSVSMVSPATWPTEEERKGKKYAASTLKFNNFFEWTRLDPVDLGKFEDFTNISAINASVDLCTVLCDTKRDLILSRKSLLEDDSGNWLLEVTSYQQVIERKKCHIVQTFLGQGSHLQCI